MPLPDFVNDYGPAERMRICPKEAKSATVAFSQHEDKDPNNQRTVKDDINIYKQTFKTNS